VREARMTAQCFLKHHWILEHCGEIDDLWCSHQGGQRALMREALYSVPITPFTMSFAMFFVMPLVTPAFAARLIAFAIARRVDIVIPTILHKIHRAVTCTILAAMFAPISCMPWRHPQIDRFVDDPWRWLDNNRLGINHLGLGKTADIQTAIEAGIAHADRYTDIRRAGHATSDEHRRSRTHQITLHVDIP
jgi:hypothetical protein